MQRGASHVECVWENKRVVTSLQRTSADVILIDWSLCRIPSQEYIAKFESNNGNLDNRKTSDSISSDSLMLIRLAHSIVHVPVIFLHLPAEVRPLNGNIYVCVCVTTTLTCRPYN